MWIVLWSWTSCAAASYSMRRSSAPLYPRPAYASFTSYAVANMQISLPSGATNAMSSSALMVCAFAVANAQGRPTPITTTTSMKTFSTQRPSYIPPALVSCALRISPTWQPSSGWAYLSLVTDAASRLIVGWLPASDP